MVAFNSLALLSVTAIGTLAAPAIQQCMTSDQANIIAQQYGELISNYSDSLAEALLTPDFTDYSESVNTLINSCPQGDAAKPLPLLAATFSTRQQFETGQGQQPLINFKQLGLWQACNSVIIRWETTNTANITDVKPVVGLIIMDTIKAPAGSQHPFHIKTVYSEFDAGAWLQNLQEAGICRKADGSSDVPTQGAPKEGSSQSQPPSGTAEPTAAGGEERVQSQRAQSTTVVSLPTLTTSTPTLKNSSAQSYSTSVISGSTAFTTVWNTVKTTVCESSTTAPQARSTAGS